MSNAEVTDTLARGRTWRESIMLDTCVITRATGPEVYHPDTATYSQPTTTVYTGPCRAMPWRGNEEQAAETEVTVYRYRIQFPMTGATPEIKRYDVVTITASIHPWMAGKVLQITEPELGTTATALTVIAEVSS
jgi:hypothetical protein